MPALYFLHWTGSEGEPPPFGGDVAATATGFLLFILLIDLPVLAWLLFYFGSCLRFPHFGSRLSRTLGGGGRDNSAWVFLSLVQPVGSFLEGNF